MPYPSDLVFNASVVEHNGKYVMLYRNEFYPDKNNLRQCEKGMGLADSDDGIHWEPRPGFIDIDKGIITHRAYDPRLVSIPILSRRKFPV